MKNLPLRMIGYHKVVSLVLVVLTAFSVPEMAMAAPPKAWTNIGSVGVVDDTDLSRVKLSLSRAYLGSGVSSGTIRYNVTATEGLFLGPNKTLSVRFFKPDNFSRVQAYLWSVDISTGAHSLLMTYDNVNAPVNAITTQTQSVMANLPQDFDFDTKTYFIEVILSRQTNANGFLLGDPRIELLKIVSQ